MTLRQRRERMGLTGREVAEAMGMATKSIHRIERHEREGKPVPKWYGLALLGLEREWEAEQEQRLGQKVVQEERE